MRRRSWIANGDAGMCVFCVCLSACACVYVWVKGGGGWEVRGGQAGSWGVEYSGALSLSKSRRETSLEAWSSRCSTSKRCRVFLNRESNLTVLNSPTTANKVWNRPVNWNKMEMDLVILQVFFFVCVCMCVCQSFVTSQFFYWCYTCMYFLKTLL